MLLLDSYQTGDLVRELYSKCYLITPFSSQYFSQSDITNEQARYSHYSLQGSSLAVRLSDIAWGDIIIKFWFDNTTKRNIIEYIYGDTTIDENGDQIATSLIPDDKLDEELDIILESEEQESNHLTDTPLISLRHAIITQQNWQLLSIDDKDKMLYVYGIVGEAEIGGDSDAALDYSEALDKLLRLQSLAAQEIRTLDPEAMNFTLGRGAINLVYDILSLTQL